MIEFKNVYFQYPHGGASLKNIDFKVEKGEFVALVGENGAGKSTMLKLINGILKPINGDVVTAGFNTKNTKISQIAKHTGFLFQNPDRQICCQSVKKEIMFSLNLLNDMTAEEKEERAEKIINAFSLNPDENTFAMSRGEKQKTALASALASEPEVLILDEPTTGLDYRECTAIMDFVKKLNKEKNITVFMVCHDMEIVMDYADRVIALAQGEMVDDDTPENIFRKKDVLKKAYLLPPQITELASLLGGEFENCDSAEEIIEVLKKQRKGEL